MIRPRRTRPVRQRMSQRRSPARSCPAPCRRPGAGGLRPGTARRPRADRGRAGASALEPLADLGGAKRLLDDRLEPLALAEQQRAQRRVMAGPDAPAGIDLEQVLDQLEPPRRLVPVGVLQDRDAVLARAEPLECLRDAAERAATASVSPFQTTRSSQSPSPVSGRIGSQHRPSRPGGSLHSCSLIACCKTRGRAWRCSSTTRCACTSPASS